MYKSWEPKQALINGAWWSAGKGKQQLNKLAPPVRKDNCISPADSCGRHTAIAGYHRWCFFLFRVSVLYGRNLFSYFFLLIMDVSCVGCGSIHTHEDRWIRRWCNSLSFCLSLCLTPFFFLLVSFGLLPISVSFPINNNSWIKLSGNFRGILCYSHPSC